MQRLEVDGRLALRNHQEQPALGILQEQVLGVSAGQVALEARAFRHREHGLMLDRVRADAERVEILEELCAGCGHRKLQACELVTSPCNGRPGRAQGARTLSQGTALRPAAAACIRRPLVAYNAPRRCRRQRRRLSDAGVAQG